jgi:hypothetical protein
VVPLRGRSHGDPGHRRPLAAAEPPATALRLEAVKKNTDIWALTWSVVGLLDSIPALRCVALFLAGVRVWRDSARYGFLIPSLPLLASARSSNLLSLLFVTEEARAFRARISGPSRLSDLHVVLFRRSERLYIDREANFRRRRSS